MTAITLTPSIKASYLAPLDDDLMETVTEMLDLLNELSGDHEYSYRQIFSLIHPYVFWDGRTTRFTRNEDEVHFMMWQPVQKGGHS